MGAHIIDGEFQSDKYPTCPRGKVPLSVKDKTAQDLLWEYAHRRRSVDAEFADDLEASLKAAGYQPAAADAFLCESCNVEIKEGDKYTVTMDGCYLCEAHAPTYQDCAGFWNDHVPEGEDEEEAARDSRDALAAHVAAGGSPNDKPLSVM